MKKMKKMTIIYFAIAAVLMSITLSFAAYTSLSSVKRVVTVKGTEQLFTSDLLLEYNDVSELQKRVTSFGEGIEEKRFVFKVSNHIQGDITKYDTKGLSYTLKIELVDSTGSAVENKTISEGVTLYSLLNINGETYTNPYTVEGVFAAGDPHDDEYTIILGEEIMNYNLKITAVPSGNLYKSIGRIVVFSTDATVASGWVGNFMDTEQAAVTNNQSLGIINYKITGQTEGDYLLSWNSQRVEIDEWFLEKVGKSSSDITLEEDGKTKSLMLHLGVAGTPDQYIITFYRTYAEKDLNETWDIIKEYIVFGEVEQAGGGN